MHTYTDTTHTHQVPSRQDGLLSILLCAQHMNELGRCANSLWMGVQRVKGVTASVAPELTFTLVLAPDTFDLI